MQNKIELVNISKQFKNETVLKNITMTVEEKAVYGLLGPNGSGKSTTLKIITGVLKPTSGKIYINQKNWKQEHLNKIGTMIEGPAIYPNLTAYENLDVLATLLHISKERIGKVLEIVNLTTTGSKLAKNFSLGMKQRLGIAMALLNDPEIIILDEPTNGLDPVGIKELRELIISFPKKGKTVILSSHLLSEVQQVSDKIGIIHQGVLAYEGENSKSEKELEALFMEIISRGERDV
ncbi:lantibiotic protection ABC transporter ATP-binding subunit [Facklamia lactis]|uniref:lantibiotic protection ABC transporter ATP-binding subunit n=1 Tax=Facklamia lactis TaxID=2749967 RepID=UPI0018CE083C|nr:lantibiotic protection ABC transporter ATP-binding subunit [Facklamia lactis]MBG9981108.1 lantibiotic protection ABC transporter ATP-binding subunit [Facklamia lactis]